MLVLSRRVGETIELPEIGVAVQVVGLRKSKVQLGIDAPREITVSRGELPRGGQPVARTARHPQLLNELARLETDLIALAELAGDVNRSVADSVCGEARIRIAALRRVVRLGPPEPPYSIAELVNHRTTTSRSATTEQRRPAQLDHQRPVDGVRQTSAGYAVVSSGRDIA